jgi:PEP-CTERM motif
MKIAHMSLAAMLALGAATANAAIVTVDFSGNTQGAAIDATYAPLGLTFTSAQFLQCGGGCPAPTPNGWFAFSNDASNSFTAFFAAAQTSISFQTVSFSSTLAQAFDASNTLVASIAEDQTTPISEAINTLSGVGITKVVFSFNGGLNGPAITNLTFNASTAVPEPGSWVMLIAGFGLVGAAARRRAAALAA